MSESIHPLRGIPESRAAARTVHEESPVTYVGIRQHGTPVVVREQEETRLTPDRSLEVVNHSPTGFEWGYAGSGPAQLALALLLDYYDDEATARRYYMQFKAEVVSTLGCDGADGRWELTGETIENAITEIQEEYHDG
ncbi:DUF6166 domain-containing protein [Haloferax sp. KTX1]|uniref:DUF6166 domain-containing protein n=1 Tax=Haloferax sp. KTX1 TaxID=2600597 RepID=UPI001C9E9EDD|nr:DUF6166 domain-containing protein [Haloferax sp. KTX1]